MKSLILTGHVRHERFEKTRYPFDYPVYFYALDLDELETLSRTVRGFACNRFAPVSIHDEDFLQRGDGAIRQKLDGFLESRGLKSEIQRVMLVTCARFFNHVFNPVSFYYCYGDGEALRCVVMEVNNTFDERHLYMLDEPLEDLRPDGFHAKAKKAFHVSPFFDRAGEYDCRFSPISEAIDIHINLFKEGKPAMVTRWSGKARPLTTANLWKVLLRYPLTALMTLPRIHWQAVRLYFGKKLKHFKKPPPQNTMTIRTARPKLRERMAMALVIRALKRMNTGKLSMLLPGGRALTFGDPESSRQALIKVHHFNFFWRLVKDGGIGLGEGYMVRDWESPDPVAALNVFIENKEAMQTRGKWMGLLNAVANTLLHVLRDNSLARSLRNIRAHYDLSNDFFKSFLDESMMYSCALFTEKGQSLARAQQNKIDHIIRKARIGKDDHVLEIGCGWGGFAIQAVKRTGCRVTGITLSREQLELARERVKEQGLEDRIELHLCDYRKLRGQFDRIVSIEMLEAVGHRYFDAYFKACERLLKPQGIGVFQVITIPDQRYEEYRRSCDFIQKHIFPGGHLPSLTALCQSMTRASGFMMEHVENIGDHYAETLKLWREQFMSRREEIEALGFDSVFVRKWEFYFIYCESAYRMRHINNLQFVITRTGNRMLAAGSERTYEQTRQS